MSLFDKYLEGKDFGYILDVATYSGDFINTITKNIKSYKYIVGADRYTKGYTKDNKIFQESDRDFIVTDAHQLAFRDNCFDIVAMNVGIHHLDDPKKCMFELKRVLKPGGLLVIREMYGDNLNEKQTSDMLMHHWHSKIDRLEGKSHYPSLKRDEIIELIEGLKLSKYELDEYLCTKCDPEKDGKVEREIKETEERLQKIKHLPEYLELEKEARYIIDYIKANGFACAPEMEIVGVK